NSLLSCLTGAEEGARSGKLGLRYRASLSRALPQGRIMAASPYEQLEQEFRRLHAFRGALSLLRWDAAVMMPRGSADVRGEQLAALETEHHALLTTPKVARLLERAEAAASQLDDWPLANLHEMRRQ